MGREQDERYGGEDSEEQSDNQPGKCQRQAAAGEGQEDVFRRCSQRHA